MVMAIVRKRSAAMRALRKSLRKLICQFDT